MVSRTPTRPPLTCKDGRPRSTAPRGFHKGMAKMEGSGRKKGQQNHITKLLKEEIIAAAVELGDMDFGGRDQLRGYLMFLGRNHPKAYSSLLARVLPYQVNASVENTHKVYRTREEIEEAMRERGLPVPSRMFN